MHKKGKLSDLSDAIRDDTKYSQYVQNQVNAIFLTNFTKVCLMYLNFVPFRRKVKLLNVHLFGMPSTCWIVFRGYWPAPNWQRCKVKVLFHWITMYQTKGRPVRILELLKKLCRGNISGEFWLLFTNFYFALTLTRIWTIGFIQAVPNN